MMIHYCEMKDKVFHWLLKGSNIWDEIFKNRPSKIFVRHPEKNLQGHGNALASKLSVVTLSPFLTQVLEGSPLPCTSKTTTLSYSQGGVYTCV